MRQQGQWRPSALWNQMNTAQQAPKEQCNPHGRLMQRRVLQQLQATIGIRPQEQQVATTVTPENRSATRQAEGQLHLPRQAWRESMNSASWYSVLRYLGKEGRGGNNHMATKISSLPTTSHETSGRKKEQPPTPWHSPPLLNIKLLPLWYTVSNQFILSPLLTELLFSDVQSYLNQGWTLLQMVTIPKYIIFVHRLFSVFGYFSLGWARPCHLISLHFKDKKLEYELNTEISSCCTTGEMLFWDGNLNHKLPGNSIISQLGSPAHSKM